MNNGCRNRRYDCTIALVEKFECNTHMIEKTVWQDENDFTLDDRVYGKRRKSDVPDEDLLHPQIRCQEKLWFPLQSLGTVPRNRFL